ncbi:MAG TPA: M36 family metallopeptidase [Nocardioides sp.]|uniref:M36 family metallopeptidase n=1 Tax=Nocardioides sp. TaxID=35761 RepID=UPI002D7ED539|nr:M36 family metallopeptidase [Nocardioides sp.]HET6652232.1 M36 family metallopeptidase [Nocardioides sp.]
MHKISSRAALAAASSVALLGGGLVAVTPAQAAPSDRIADQPVRVHWADGKALAGKSDQAPGQVVKQYLSGKSVGAAADTLSSEGSWKARGLTVVRFGQTLAGLRVPATDAKAVFDDRGRLVSVIENTAKVSGPPAAASASDDDALRAAVASLYPKRSVTTSGAKTTGNTTKYAVQGFSTAPTVEKVALPTTAGKAAVGYQVTTWTADNQLNITTVDGAGKVVDNELRTNNEQYNVFREDPVTTPQAVQTDPYDPVASANGWLAGGPQWSNHISGNNANTYLDTDNDNKPDANRTPVGNERFLTAWDGTVAPTTPANQEVAVQNLFYLNNLIHDTLYRAGFTPAAGNFQEQNFGEGGKDSDAVQAEAQDGGGTDNANFATPTDGQNPRMQMYLWNQPETHEVLVGGQAFTATGATWGTPLDATGRTGPLVVANDGTGTAGDACEPIPAATGAIVIADRGTCDFVVKAKNAENAGAVGIVVANNRAGLPITMGGEDPSLTIAGVMVSQADGATLKSLATASATIRLRDPAPLMKDASLDSDVVWHEYGHGLTWRMIGGMKGPLGGAIGEGMGDVLAVIANDDPVVGEYSASDPAGIRSASYEGYPLTYGDIVGTEVHADGEVYGAIGWDLWKQYKAAGLSPDAILKDLVTGMNFTPQTPTFEAMRDGILAGLTASGNGARECMVWNSFAKYGVGVGAVGKVVGKAVRVTESTTKPAGCA